MIRHAGPEYISDIFTTNKQLIYKIPKYQRAYTWGQNDWDLLFGDILDNEQGYFLGSMICVRSNDAKSAYETDILELIDGQQRATSLSILLLAIYKKLEPYKNELDEDDQAELITIRKELLQKDAKTGKSEPRLRLQIQNSNKDDYNSLLTEQGIIEGYKRPSNAGNRKIYKAYSYFVHLIDNYLSEPENEKNIAKSLIALYKKVNGAMVVMIEVESHSDAFMLFESLNFRGEKLSAIDLIKNSLLAEAEKANTQKTNNDNELDETDRCYNEWQQIQERLGDEYSPQERFFRQFYNAFRDELNLPFQTDESKKYPLAYKATKSTIMNIYERLIKRDYNKTLKDISAASKKYEIITNRNKESISSKYSDELLNLERIQGAPAYMLLLFLELNAEDLQLTEENLIAISHVLVLFFVRRNITDYPNTRNLDQIFMDTIQLVKGKTGDGVVKEIFNYLVSKSSSDEIFEEKLRGPIYDENDTATRFILCYIEEKHQTKEVFSDLWARDSSNKYIWTIEHIFPEGENDPDCWVRMINGKGENEQISDSDRINTSKMREKYTHTIGNLTMTGYNSNLGNKSFEQKKNRKNSDGNEIGYRNGLYLNSDVVNEESWSIQKIQARTDKLVAEALILFNFKLS